MQLSASCVSQWTAASMLTLFIWDVTLFFIQSIFNFLSMHTKYMFPSDLSLLRLCHYCARGLQAHMHVFNNAFARPHQTCPFFLRQTCMSVHNISCQAMFKKESTRTRDLNQYANKARGVICMCQNVWRFFFCILKERCIH